MATIDIITSLKVANRLKEENRAQYIGNPASLQATLEKRGWTKAMIDDLANMLKSAPALTRSHHQKNKNDSASADFEILKNFYNKVNANPAAYGISGFNTQGDYGNLYNDVMSGRNIAGFVKHLIPVVPKEPSPAETQQQIAETISAEQEPIVEESSPAEGQTSFFIFPANPFLPGVADFADIIRSTIDKCKGCVPIVMVSDQGADGAFDEHCFDSFKSHKLGVSSEFKDYCILTSFKTFAKIILDRSVVKPKPAQTISENTKREKRLSLLLNEAEAEEIRTVAQTGKRQNIKSKGFNNANFNNGFTIVAPSIYAEKIQGQSEFSKMLGIAWNGNVGTITNIDGSPHITFTPLELDLGPLRAAGTEVFKSILEYVNGKKSGSASSRGTNETIASQKMNESYYLREADENFDWSWENIKVNMGAKEYLDRLFASVTDIKKGLDDGGNPSLLLRVAKKTLANVTSSWAAALTDAADLALEGIGLGWMMPLIKAGSEELRKEKPNKTYEGIEAWVRDPSFKAISKYFGNPRDFIESQETK